jgi:NAD(P)H-quinone oxidoreductase subunit 5
VEARALLVVVGVLTAVVASVVMTTRVSVKVALAWSTCAQMGFMLLQCGLGLWEMALLHLLAHSAYKAHAFLGAGGTVRQTRRLQLAGPGAHRTCARWRWRPGSHWPPPPRWLQRGNSCRHLGADGHPVAHARHRRPALVPLTTLSPSGRGASLVGRAMGVPFAYLALHELVGRFVPDGPTAPAPLLVFAGLGFLVLFGIQSSLIVAPESRLAQRVRPWVYAGLFLDDAFTRVAFSISPPPAPTPRPAPLPQPAVVAVLRTGTQVAASP